MFAGFASSCDEVEDDKDPVADKKLVKETISDTYGESINMYEYDNKSRCIKSIGPEDYEIQFTYDGNKAIGVENTGRQVTLTYDANGYLERIDWPTDQSYFVFKYDNKGQIVSEISYDQFGGQTIYMYEWENGNIIMETESQMMSDGSSEVVMIKTFAYTNDEYVTPLENKTSFFLLYTDPVFAANIGVRCKNLPVSVDYEVFWDFDLNVDDQVLDSNNYTEKCAWTFDKDGYPTSLKVDRGENIINSEYTWQ